MSTESLADHRREPTTREARWRAIRERTTRGLLAFNRGDVLHLEGDCWAVRSSRGGYHRVDLDSEVCGCEDFVHYGRVRDLCCKHIYAVAIAHGTRRGRRRQPVEDRPCACVRGWVYIGHLVPDPETQAQGEVVDAVRCRRCNR